MVKASNSEIKQLLIIFNKKELYNFYKKNNLKKVEDKIGALEKIMKIDGYRACGTVTHKILYKTLEEEFLDGEWRLFYGQKR